mgnify:CR=1 FL=1
MADSGSAVPWVNLWRWVVSSGFFFFVLVMPIVIITEVFELPFASIIHAIVLLASPIIAATVVWSEDIPWPGDPERSV